MNPIDAFLRGQGFLEKQSYIDDSRELLVDEVMTLIDEGLSVLVDSPPAALAQATVSAVQSYYDSVVDLQGGVGTPDDVFHAAARAIGVIMASYAQVLRDTQENE